MVKPTKEDAHLLLHLEQMFYTELVQKANDWFWGEFHPKKIKDYAEFKKAYPEGSEGSRHAARIAEFLEMAGVLVNKGLLHEDLFFDRYMVRPYWESLRPLAYAGREETQEPSYWENFELLYGKEQAWNKKHTRNYPARAPLGTGLSGTASTGLIPSEYPISNSMPSEISPIIFLGSRLTTNNACFP